MRRAMLILLCFALMPWTVHAGTVWATVQGATVRGSGDLLTEPGAALTLTVDTPHEAGFAGAITSLDASEWRGQEITVSGSITVVKGGGGATIWIRADGAKGSLAFKNSQRSPVLQTDGAQERVVRLHVPEAATSIKLGALLESVGEAQITSLRLAGARDPDAGVSALAVLEAAMDAMESQALHAARIDWQAERKRLLRPELASAAPGQAFAAIEGLIRRLDDGHSALQPPRDAANYRAQASPTRAVEVRASNGVGYVLVPGLVGTDREQSRVFSDALCQAIERHASAAPVGWIVDLRSNGGGNMWPMLAGLRPLLGDAPPGAFVDRNGRASPWRVDAMQGCDMDLSSARVAVLIGPKTASSGEAVALAFRARPGTRFIGAPTAGLATANRSIQLPGGATLLLTTGLFADRSGATYPNSIPPDPHMGNERTDEEVADAWLRAQPRPPTTRQEDR